MLRRRAALQRSGVTASAVQITASTAPPTTVAVVSITVPATHPLRTAADNAATKTNGNFVMGLLFWYMMRGIKKYLQKIPFVNKYVPSWLETTLATLTVVVVIMVMFNIISANIKTLSQSYADYEANVESVLDLLNQKYGLDILESVKGQTQNLDFGEILGNILGTLSTPFTTGRFVQVINCDLLDAR